MTYDTMEQIESLKNRPAAPRRRRVMHKFNRYLTPAAVGAVLGASAYPIWRWLGGDTLLPAERGVELQLYVFACVLCCYISTLLGVLVYELLALAWEDD